MATIPRNVFQCRKVLRVHHQTILMKPLFATVASDRALIFGTGFLADSTRKPDPPGTGVGFDSRQ